MVALTPDDVRRVAELARLELTDEEVALFTGQLARIIEYVEQIQGIDTLGVPPMSHASSRPLERPDLPRPSLSRTEALENAPDAASESGLFKVPRVFG